MRLRLLLILLLLAAPDLAADADKSPASAAAVKAVLPNMENLYTDLHQHPELSFHEQRTAATLADG
ncbi:MAG TPA: amidohydrolase, partial [Terriglobales bacterium]|nr:amidohydrolase [Terriglobales bacterium]